MMGELYQGFWAWAKFITISGFSGTFYTVYVPDSLTLLLASQKNVLGWLTVTWPRSFFCLEGTFRVRVFFFQTWALSPAWKVFQKRHVIFQNRRDTWHLRFSLSSGVVACNILGKRRVMRPWPTVGFGVVPMSRLNTSGLWLPLSRVWLLWGWGSWRKRLKRAVSGGSKLSESSCMLVEHSDFFSGLLEICFFADWDFRMTWT